MTDAHPVPSGPDEQAPSAPPVLDGAGDPAPEGRPRVEPMRLSPLLPRRQSPWLVVDVDGSPSSYRGLVWALREAARREATVVAVCVLDDAHDDLFGGLGRPSRRDAAAAQDRLEAQVLRAIGETGVVGRSRTTVLDRPVFEALIGAARGADLVVVSSHGKTLLRPAVPRPPARRLARGA
ncbi:universal stress protein [Geodermatophilus sabuli]|uniref:Universal stress protein n=1 Tax=Geodermatophilus sabuli TaxID=1564158 RepID=A0A7K3W4K9_9ACTN|nr:universal stress protein [Geodermatophilus sabuli]NEK59806.1 universal stress protein [Geodermatophilus sabuli]